MKVVAVIPARFASTRLPGKPLANIGGKPMVQWVYLAAQKSGVFDEVWVATDDSRVEKAVQEFSGKVQMTDPRHRSGTERLAEVARSIEADIFVNVQGDEPFLESEVMAATVSLVRSGKFTMASAMTSLEDAQDLQNPNVVKVVTDKNARALYFSRFPIPYSRVPAKPPLACYRHIGLYAYRRAMLLELATLPPGTLELAESLEQLRALENGVSIGMARVESRSFGIDTPLDLERARLFC